MKEKTDHLINTEESEEISSAIILQYEVMNMLTRKNKPTKVASTSVCEKNGPKNIFQRAQYCRKKGNPILVVGSL